MKAASCVITFELSSDSDFSDRKGHADGRTKSGVESRAMNWCADVAFILLYLDTGFRPFFLRKGCFSPGDRSGGVH